MNLTQNFTFCVNTSISFYTHEPVKNFQIDTLKLNQHDIELKIHKYVKANYGKFDVLDAATNLGLPVELVETIALKLINQGKIQKVL